MYKIILTTILSICLGSLVAQQADKRVDNLKYWAEMIKLGRAPQNPKIKVPAARNKGNQVQSPLISVTVSTDVLIGEPEGGTLSENSVAANPADNTKALNANNTIDDNPNGLDGFYIGEFRTASQGSLWTGGTFGPPTTFCDPATAISNNGRYYIGYIEPNLGQSIAISTDEGASWTHHAVASGFTAMRDKNHLWVDKSLTSPYQHNLYAAWTDFGGPNDSRVVFTRSTDGGLTWSPDVNISAASAGAFLDQGVNLQSGPNGEVYAIWAIYDNVFAFEESDIGFAISTDGGANFQPSTRIISNIHGIRGGVTGKNMRTNSFPVMAVDNSFGPYRGTIYVVWTNIGTPGINTGDDVDIYMIKSTDQGANWSAPQLVHSKVPGAEKKHYFPWITCDQMTGKLHIIYYDDRDVSATECEAWMSSSFDGGDTWSEYRVSDVAFTPSPVTVNPNIAFGYFGDYLGVSAFDDVIYPVWTDNRTGLALSYTSPLLANDLCAPTLNLQNITMPQPATFKYRAQNTISVAGSGTDFIMQGNGASGATASMVAGGSITLLPGTHIQQGSRLTVVPGPCTSNILFVRAPGKNMSTIREVDDMNAAIRIYPNPANAVIYIDLKKAPAAGTVYTYILNDLMGRVIEKGNLSKQVSPLSTTRLKAGGYILVVYDDKKIIGTKKIVKE